MLTSLRSRIGAEISGSFSEYEPPIPQHMSAFIHLGNFVTGLGQQLARLLRDVECPLQMTGVVAGDLFQMLAFLETQAPACYGSMKHDTAKGGIQDALAV